MKEKDYRVHFVGTIDVSAEDEEGALEKACDELNWAQGIRFDLGECDPQ